MTKAIKNDSEKPSLAYIPKEAMWEMSKAFSAGKTKYGPWNYKSGLELTRTLSASLRHIYQFLDGEDFDSETQSLHLGNAMANLAMAIDTYYNNKQLDDRHKNDHQPEVISRLEMQEQMDNSIPHWGSNNGC